MSFGGVGSMNIVLKNNKLLRRHRTKVSEIYKDSKYLSCKIRRNLPAATTNPWVKTAIRERLKREKYTRDLKLIVFMLFAASVLSICVIELFSS